MERILTDNEKNKINQICKSKITLATSYISIIKIIAPIFTILFFLFLYLQISLGSVWIYIALSILISIIEIIELSNVQKPYLSIKDNNYICFESEMISCRKTSVLTSTKHRAYFYYILVNIKGEVKEIKYLGKDFDFLRIGESMLILQFENRKKEQEYVCFSNKEIHS